MRFFAVLTFMLLFNVPAYALNYEEGSDAPTRTIEDYIGDYIDLPDGAVDWKLFSRTKEINIELKDADGFDLQYFKPEFPQELKELDGKQVTIKGYMFPMDEADEQKRFLFGPFPINCPFQYHVGPSLVIEVLADKKPVLFSYDPVVLTGRLELVPKDDNNSIFYRLHDVKKGK